MSQEQDKIFFRNFSLALAFIAVMMVVFFVVAQFAATDEEADAKMRASAVAEVTAPVGEVTAVGEETEEITEEVVADAGDAAGDNPGKTTFEGVCAACHGVPAMASMIPQTGDAAAWEARIEKGIDTLYENAINGFTGDMGMMPARGMNPKLTDDEVKAAVDYMVSTVGEETEEITEEVVADAGSEGGADEGKSVYEGLCVNCHGIAALASMIPQSGDAAAWEARIAKGTDVLYENAINGFVGDMGMMPGKGGNLKLTDDQVKAAVDYMINQVQ